MVGQSPEIPTPFTALAPARPDLSEGVNLAYGPRSPVTLASLENIGTPIRPSATFVGDANSVPPHIRVQLQDAPLAPGQALPSATVQKDGSVLDSTGQVAIDANGVVKNQAFVTNPPMQSDLTIAVQRDVGQPVTTEAQQNVLNRLTDIWAKNIQTAYGDKLQTIQTTDGQSIRQVNIDDPSQLVSQAVEQKYGTGIPQDKIASTQPPVESGTEANPTPDISPATSGMAQRVNRDFPQGGSGQITGDQAGSYYPQRNVDRTAEGPDTDYLNTLSALAQQPVDHARHVPGGYKFGSYDTGPHIFGNWLGRFLPQDILNKLRRPDGSIDWSKLAELLKDPAMLKEVQDALKEKGASKELQANFASPDAAQKFADFTAKVTSGKGEISAAEMKGMMPEALQKQIALDTVRSWKGANGKITPSDIALGYSLDKPANELTAQDRESPQGKAIASAANRLYQMSYAHGQNPDGALNWTGDNIDPNSVAFRLVKNAAASMDGTPYGCVRSHQANMQKTFGFTPHGDAFANFQDTWRHLATTGKFDLIHVNSQSQLRPGDIFGVPWTARTTAEMGWGRNAGHVGVVGTGGVEYSQHAFSTGMIFSGRYDISQLYVIRAKTTASQA